MIAAILFWLSDALDAGATVCGDLAYRVQPPVRLKGRRARAVRLVVTGRTRPMPAWPDDEPVA